MTVTIKDVAKLAKVAPSTVSRVIANNPRISDKTKERVREAMKELGYHPNFIARSLASKSTQSIGLVMPSSADKVFQNPFFPEVIRGISKGAHEKQYSLHMSTGETEDEIFDGLIQMVQGRRVDGVVLLYSRFDDEVVSYLQKRNFPFVVIGKPYKNIEEINHVDNDNYRASKEITEYLIGLGHERIAFVGGNLNFVVTIDRLLGYEKAIRNSGLTYRDEYISHEEFLKEGGQEAITELLSLEEPPTALVVADDLMALGILGKLDEMGKVVPEDISVISFNNVLLTEISRPPLTSVDINIFRLGYEAAKSLIQLAENPNETVKRIIVPYKVIKRQSCGVVNKMPII
ncbi:LacI family DNA-binding transcriptional regulator [Cytobacillus sp. S13-E01]|uniref:LacI family DNA-binding transcriptional regulator n=1 Tax=Cytobacillus sp. S13-E01 TaxID=3031326 RepID=UPI0023D8420F|nr:LacI family DNA-binding transcriptional regulator [Cytobacillus sp. S13-E01]MDF0726981.1 LacI family DNA-binding transcriptional regulator [Cytobacillus sp. S13-E01]